MNVQKALTWIGFAFVVTFILSSPADAKDVVDSAFAGLDSAAQGLRDFVKSVAG